jgi:hypothetical protein
MIKLLIFYLIYIYFIYQIYIKAKENKRDLLRFKENIGRTIFIQVAFATIELIQGKFILNSFLYRFLFSLIAFTLYPLAKDLLDKIIVF